MILMAEATAKPRVFSRPSKSCSGPFVGLASLIAAATAAPSASSLPSKPLYWPICLWASALPPWAPAAAAILHSSAALAARSIIPVRSIDWFLLNAVIDER